MTAGWQIDEEAAFVGIIVTWDGGSAVFHSLYTAAAVLGCSVTTIARGLSDPEGLILRRRKPDGLTLALYADYLAVTPEERRRAHLAFKKLLPKP